MSRRPPRADAAPATTALPPEKQPGADAPAPIVGVTATAAADRSGLVPDAPSTQPLPSDQTSATREPAAATVVTPAREEPAATSLPRPEAAPDPEPVATDTARVDVRVPGTIPLPSDQLTPVVTTELAAEPIDFGATLASLSPEQLAELRAKLLGAEESSKPVDPDERRSFRAVFDIAHDGETIRPGGRVRLTRDEHARLRTGGAIAAAWDDDE